MESFTEDTLFTITSYLTSHDIVNFALTCKYFGGKPGGYTAKKKKTKRRKKNKTIINDDQSSKDRQWSLMEEMAKRRVENKKG